VTKLPQFNPEDGSGIYTPPRHVITKNTTILSCYNS